LDDHRLALGPGAVVLLLAGGAANANGGVLSGGRVGAVEERGLLVGVVQRRVSRPGAGVTPGAGTTPGISSAPRAGVASVGGGAILGRVRGTRSSLVGIGVVGGLALLAGGRLVAALGLLPVSIRSVAVGLLLAGRFVVGGLFFVGRLAVVFDLLLVPIVPIPVAGVALPVTPGGIRLRVLVGTGGGNGGDRGENVVVVRGFGRVIRGDIDVLCLRHLGRLVRELVPNGHLLLFFCRPVGGS